MTGKFAEPRMGGGHHQTGKPHHHEQEQLEDGEFGDHGYGSGLDQISLVQARHRATAAQADRY
ncbi:MAG: hypothetical protein HC888_13540 [Candidatus Competibacteraceae bacterium]|nr:hypothetical protein [Candidatus Competibacteraceae bacterium]